MTNQTSPNHHFNSLCFCPLTPCAINCDPTYHSGLFLNWFKYSKKVPQENFLIKDAKTGSDKPEIYIPTIYITFFFNAHYHQLHQFYEISIATKIQLQNNHLNLLHSATESGDVSI